MKQVKLTLPEYRQAIKKLSNNSICSLTNNERIALVGILTKDANRREKAAETRRQNLECANNEAAQQENGDSSTNKSGSDADPTIPNETPDKDEEPSSKPRKRQSRQIDEEAKHTLLNFQSGQSCPRCSGKMYKDKDRVVIRITCAVPFSREKNFLETAVCKTCGYSKSADPGFDEKKLVSECTPQAAAFLIVFHYYLGMAFSRVSTLMNYFSRNLSASKQWDIVNEASDRLLPLFTALWCYARENAISVQADDSGARILKPPENSNTTALYFDTGQHTISIMVTGAQHAGDVTSTLIKSRKETKPIVRVGDAAAKNIIVTDGFIDGCCNEHAFAYFRKIRDNHPENYEFVARIFGQVFENEQNCKNLSPMSRLRYHQEHSAPLMAELSDWALNKLSSQNFEDNSDEGTAVKYLANHFVKLTEFLRTPGVPLDSNRVEQLLRVAKRYFRNSSFYLTDTGAEVGDIMMSLARTAVDAGVSPIEYLTWCLENYEDLKINPTFFFPWNFKKEFKKSA